MYKLVQSTYLGAISKLGNLKQLRKRSIIKVQYSVGTEGSYLHVMRAQLPVSQSYASS